MARILSEGDFGPEVAALKQQLNALGYDCGEGEAFDRRTAWAVCWFRYRNGLLKHKGWWPTRKTGLDANGAIADEAVLTLLQSEDAVHGVTERFQYYSMKEPLWAQYPYDAANTPEIERMQNSACGPTSMAMAVSTALHRAVLPPVLADWSNAHGFRDPDGIHGTDDSFFPACAEIYGLTAELIPIENAQSFARAAEAIAAGNAVICNVVPGSPYTSCGHYNLISDVVDGRVQICDPVPKNMEIPAYTVEEWLAGGWGRHYIIVGKK